MSNREKLTRRAALALMAGGGTLAASETVGFTSLSAARELGISVADDENASLKIEGLKQSPTYTNPHAVRLTNNSSGQFGDLILRRERGNHTIDDGDDTEKSNSDEVHFTNVGTSSSEAVTVSGAGQQDDYEVEVPRNGTNLTVSRDNVDLANLSIRAWYDANRPQSVVLRNGSDIDNWNDRRSNAHLSNDDTIDPGYSTDPRRATFADANDAKRSAATRFDSDGNLTAFVVMNATSTGRAFSLRNTSPETEISFSTNGEVLARIRGSTTKNIGDIATGLTIASLRIDWDGSNSQLRAVVDTSLDPVDAGNIYTSSLGNQIQNSLRAAVGARSAENGSAFSERYQGDVYEAFVYDQSLGNSSQEKIIDDYLKVKWKHLF